MLLQSGLRSARANVALFDVTERSSMRDLSDETKNHVTQVVGPAFKSTRIMESKDVTIAYPYRRR